MEHINSIITIDQDETDKLIFESYLKLENYWKKYRSPIYKDEFFNDSDYADIISLFQRVKLTITYIKILNLEVEIFNPIIPFDLKWKEPRIKVNNALKTTDMTLLCDDVKSLTDDLEIAYENIRNDISRTKVFNKVSYLNILFDLHHIKLITDYGSKVYGLTWDGLDFNFPSDLIDKVPAELKELTYEDYPL